MSVTLTTLITETQTRCDALTNFSTISEIIDCGISAKKVEMAGGVITRTTLDTQIQRAVNLSGGSSAIEDLIALAACVEIRATPKVRKTQAFTSTGTWTRPLGVNQVTVLVVGGGGGGAGAAPSGGRAGGGGGGGGEVILKDVDVTGTSVGATITVTIGAGGAAGTAGSNGSVGGDTSFGSLVTALGGGGGDGYVGSVVISGTARGTSGGGSAVFNNGGYSTVYCGGVGGGAGGHAIPGLIAMINNGLYSSLYRTPLVKAAATTRAGQGAGAAAEFSNTSNDLYYLTRFPIAGPALYGYGAGGGISGTPNPVPGLYGAGGGASINASANSGGGGGGSNTAGLGGNGGSGYCLLEWWE